MKLIKWNPFRHIRNLFSEDYPEVILPEKGWDVEIDVYEEKENTIAEMNLQELDPEKVNIYLKQKSIIVSQEDEEKDMKEENNETDSFKKIITFPKSIKKVVFKAVLNIAG